MRCVVKVTERYALEAKRHSCAYVVERFKKKVESLNDFEHNKSDEYGFDDYVRKEHKNFRSMFVFKNFTIAGQPVRCYLALRVFKRGDSEYSRFIKSTTHKPERDIISGLNAIDWHTLQREIDRELKAKPTIAPLPPLSVAEEAFIQRDHGITQEIFDTPIYESRSWVETVRQDDFGDPFKVATSVEQAIYENPDTDNYGIYEIPYGDKGDKVLCCRLRVSEKKDGWFLLGLGSDEKLAQLRTEMAADLEQPSYPTLARKCRRAYPLSMLTDKDFWRDMEKDKDSNFILSDEEIGIVASPLQFPLFISGRAGSGKSTMLQYLFAEFFLRYLSNTDVKPPVYLSYSANLIDNAKKLSSSLFRDSHAYLEQLKNIGKTFQDDVEPQYVRSFFVFQQLVRECIAEQNRGVLDTRFANGRHVTYSKYRELWNEKFGKDPKAVKEYGPALSWHVIRTYIKGWDSESYCYPEDYAGIGSGNKSVSDEVFAQVHEKVWEKWYHPLQEQNSLWDDQDLVRYCLAPDDDSCDTCVSERFSAIFCDESQDFTRTETDFILRLSLFANRRIYNASTLGQLPFVFAGDEFQTLNPTGFSWDSLRSYFTERLVHATELGQAISAPEPKPLTRNYRSTAPIVRLANRLQLLRQARCENDSKTLPQVPYYAESDADSVYCLNPTNPLVWKKLGDMGVSLIVPCADGQSPKDFIEASPIKGMIEFYDDGSPKNITIYNPVQAKGLEYPCVAIYGFDHMRQLQLAELANWLTNAKPDSETTNIELKYFLSNAYVSVTRAKNKLFILSDFSHKSFWAFAFSSENRELQDTIASLEQRMLARLRNPQDWKGQNGESLLGYIVEGDIDVITGESIVNAEEVAKTTEERGMALHDVGLMRQAAARYRERSKADDVQRCEAYAYLFGRKYSEAAKAFEQARLYDEAVGAYWYAYTNKDSSNILAAIARLKGHSKRLEVQIAERATKGLSLNEFKRDLDSTVRLFAGLDGETNRDRAVETQATWHNVLEIMFQRIPAPSPSDQDTVKLILDLCDQLINFGVELSAGRLAGMAYSVGNFQRAITLWEMLPPKDRPSNYHLAQCNVLPYPDNLLHRQASATTDWMQQVVLAYRKDADKHPLDDNNRRIVANAVMSAGSVDECKLFLPFLLATAVNLADGLTLIDRAQSRQVPLLKEVLQALQQARWTDLQGWHRGASTYSAPATTNFFKTLNALKYARSTAFLNKINEAFGKEKYRKVIDVMDEEFSQYSRCVWNQLLFTEVGAVMERRGFFLDSLRYYDWAVRQSDDPTFKRDMAIRWIVCKERQAEKNDNSAEYQQEASAKRSELGIESGTQLPQEPKFERWEWLFSQALQLVPEGLPDIVNATPNGGPDLRHGLDHMPPFPPTGTIPPAALPEPKQPLKQTTNAAALKHGETSTVAAPMPAPTTPVTTKTATPVAAPPVAAPPTAAPPTAHPDSKPAAPPAAPTSEQPAVAKLFDYDIDGYKFRFNPARAELSIAYQTSQDDLRVKIRKGTFPADTDFVLTDGILKKADGSETPFAMIINDTGIHLQVIASGVAITFPISVAE